MEGGRFILPSLTEREKKEKERRNKAMGVDVRRIIEQAIKPATYSHGLLSKLTLIGQTDKDGNSVLTAVKSRYNLKWGSVKAHLVSFGHFVKFMQATRPDWCDEEVVAKIDGVQKRCFTNVCKLHTVEDFDRKRNEMGSEIEPEQFASVLSSNELSRTFSYLNKLRPMMDTGNVREAVYNEHMSRLILCVQMTNGKRSGILAEMKKLDVSNAKLVDNVFVVHVSSGKTMKSYGPSKVVFSKEVHSAMRSLEKMDRCLDRHTEHCFNTFHGSALTAKQITTSVQSAWKEFYPTHINCNLIRKSIVTMSRENPLITREQQQELARTMDHSVSTADRHYDLAGGLRVSARVASLIASMCYAEPNPEDESDSEEECEEEGPESNLEEESAGEVQESELEVEVEVAGTSKGKGHARSTSKGKGCARSTSKGKGSARSITSGISDVRQKRRVFQAEKPEIPQGCSLKDPTEASVLFGKKMLFSPDEKARLITVFRRYITECMENREKKIKRADIVTVLQAAGPNFTDILQRYTVEQVYDKLRHHIRERRGKTSD